MTNLVLDSPISVDTPYTLSSTDPDFSMRSDILFRHYGAYDRALAVLGFDDVDFTHLRYDTVDTPETVDITRSEEYYAGGTLAPVPSDAARDALRAQSYLIGCRPPVSTFAALFSGSFYLVGPSYGDDQLINAVYPDFRFIDLRTRGDRGYETHETVDIVEGQALVFAVDFASLPAGALSFNTRFTSADGVKSDWSPTTTLRNEFA